MHVVASHTWISELSERAKSFDQRAEGEFRNLSLAQFNWRPDKDTWSVAQQLHHMVLANRPYADIIENLSRSAGPAKGTYSPGFLAKMLFKAVGPGDKIPAPVHKSMVPSDKPLDQSILDEFLSIQARYHAAVATLDGKDLNARFSSPFAKLIKLKLGDAIQILALHNERHLGKAFALLERSDFPR
jgi:hypothetical protein